MNFWSGMFRFPPMQSAIDIMLQKSDCTLEKLLDDEDFSQELRTNNDLIDFCCEDDVLKLILQYTTCDYPQDAIDKAREEQKKFLEKIEGLSEDEKRKQLNNSPLAVLARQNEKYHLICSSIFSDDSSRITETIAQKEELINYLFDGLKEGKEERLNSIGLVLLSCVIQIDDFKMYEIILNDESLLDLMLQHVDTFGILDTLMSLMKLEDAEKYNFIEWIISKGFIPRVLDILMTTPSIDTVGNVSTFIHNMVLWKVSSADSPAIEFLNAFNNEPKLVDFVSYVFKSEDTYLVEQSFRIISNILACSTILTYQDTENLPGIFRALQPHIKEFEGIFANPTIKKSVVTNLVFIILSLVLCGFDKIYDDLCAHNVFEAMMNAFYGDHNCSILRQTIQMTVNSIFNGQIDELKAKFINGGKTLDLMIEKDVEATQIKKEKNLAPDYYVIGANVMIQIYRSCEEREEEHDVFKTVMGHEKFTAYVNDVLLTRDTEECEYFGGSNLNAATNSSDDDYDGDDMNDDNYADEDDDDDDDDGYEEDDDEDDGMRIKEDD